MTPLHHLMPLAWSLHGVVGALMWSALATSGVVIALIWKTRLRAAATWKKCAVLSLWIHVLLACLATTVRMFVGGPGLDGDGYGPPIRVSVVGVEAGDVETSDEATPLAVSTEEPPDDDPAEDLAEAEAPAAEESAPELPPETALDAPELLAQPASVTPSDAAIGDDSLPTETADDDSTAKPAPLSAEDTASHKSRRADIPREYADRFADNRSQLVAGRGGDETTEQAVRAGLAWLASAQSRDGRWDPARFGAGQERYVLGQDRGGAGARADTGITGLAILAFLGAGHTQEEGLYADNVARGLKFLRSQQGRDGNLAGNAELFARMYCHSMSMFALCEDYAITHDPELLPAVRAAVSYSLAVQHPTDGGWRYRPGDTGDTSQLGWQVMALRSAELSGIAAPGATWTRVERFLHGVERGADGGLASYRPEGPPTRTMTAEALYCRQLLAERSGGRVPEMISHEASRSLVDDLPSPGDVNLYYWYYATLALHNAQQDSPAAADAWTRWNSELTRTLVANQAADGSWPEKCLWGGYGGRVYTTALGALCLEVYYRYARGDVPASEPNVAARDQWQSTPQR